MSRKPPKLVPIEGKAPSSPSTGTEKGGSGSACMPQLKQGSTTTSGVKPTPAPPNNLAGGGSGPSLRRSGPTRHFLNCNGSSANTRRRFISTKLAASSPAVGGGLHLTTSSNSIPDGDSTNNATSNGCGSEQLPIITPTKVNGTISNGITPKPSEPAKQLLKRTKSLGVDETGDGEESSSSDSHPNSGITFTNGRKVENSNSRSSVSTNNSQNVNKIVNATKRTSRFSQNSNVLSSKVSTPTTSRVSSPSPAAEDRMPSLVPYNTSTVSNETSSPSDTEPALDNQTAKEPILEEPKIIRKGDTVIKSYVDEKTGKIAVFEKEMKLEVCDFGSGRWYPAKVKSIDWSEQNVLVHYSNWSSRYDEWISMTSNRIRPSDDTNVVSLQFTVGERVEALWTLDSKKYPGTVTQALQQEMYEVLFDDGIKRKRTANQIFKVSHSEPPTPPHTSDKLPPPSEPVKTKSTPQPLEKPSTPSREIGVRRRMRVSANKELSRKREKPQPPKAAPPAPAPPQSESPLLDPSNRPAHYSVFDVPQGDLGKRKRKVHDYSILVGSRGRAPNIVKEPLRRPKSEGASTAIIASTETEADDSSITSEDLPPPRAVSPPKATPSKEPTEPSTDPPSTRRRKSGTATHVPTVKPSLDSPKELPVIEELVPVSVPPEAVPPVEHVETSKKRKHPTPASVTLPNATTVDTAKPILKPETTQSSAEIPPAVSTVNAVASVSTARRVKSLGVMPLSSVPSLVFADVPKDTKVDSGFADESGQPVIIEQNSENGFWKCPLNKCGKNFRKDSLLKMHLKHYHPELTVTRGIANVVQMAQARTAFENEHPSDHHGWQKLPSMEQSPAAVDSTVAETSGDSSTAAHTSDTTTSHKRISKAVNHSKENSPEKVSPTHSHKSDSGPSSTTPAPADLDLDTPQDASQTASQSSRLRLSRRRNFVVNKLGRIRANNWPNSVTPSRKRRDPAGEGSARTVIATDGTKKSKLLESEDATTISREETGKKITVGFEHSSSKTPSPSKLEKRSDQFSFEGRVGSSANEPYLVPPSCESDILSSDPSRPPRGRWNKSHIRRSLMNSSRRRVGSSILPSSTSLFLKKRMQMRKIIGKRRQKRTSILSRISSGRMRVILEALNQRSLKRRRFRADRRCRDVKVDVINCVCNSKTEFGLMIQCELCLCWQHGSCFNVQSNSQLPEYYACQSCSEPDRARLSRRFEWAESEFYKLGKLPSFPLAPSFPKEDGRTMKSCTNLTANLVEAYSMIKGLKLKERVCFGHPEHPKLYQWNTERIPPKEELQRDRFNKYFQPVLRRLMLENKSDGTYGLKLKKLAEARMNLKKYSNAVESARLTMKDKMGCQVAAYVHYICDTVLDDMIKVNRRSVNDEAEAGLRKETLEGRRRTCAEQAYHRLAKLREELLKNQSKDRASIGLSEQRFYGLENGIGPSVSSASSPSKSELSSFPNNFVRSSPNKYVNSLNPTLSPTKGGTPSTPSNGLKKDITVNMRDFCLLKRYLKERRSTTTNITATLIRMSKQFPEDWKNLMRTAREFAKETAEGEKVKWISNLVLTYNSLRILLRNIYSESNAQKQQAFCSEFEKLTAKVFDLFGIGLQQTEGRSTQNSKHQTKRTKRLETLKMVGSVTAAASELLKSRVSSSLVVADEAKSDILKRLSISTKPLSSLEVEEVLATAVETKLEDDAEAPNSSSQSSSSEVGNKPSTISAENNDSNLSDSNQPCSSTSVYFRCRRLDGRMVPEFSDQVQLIEAAAVAAGVPVEDCSEENVTLKFQDGNAETIHSDFHSGIIPVPAASRITSEVCKKNLVRDMMLQQQQIDLYLDKIEAQIIKLSSQSRQCSSVSTMKPSEMSEQRDKLLHSMELVSRLSKTLIGENDSVEQPEDMDVSGMTTTDSSDMGSSSESDDGDNTSNYSGTDTETADEGDNSGDELLDI